MGQRRTNPFRGFVDVMSEMTRMRELGRSGYEDRERTQALAWVPNADEFAGGEDLVTRVELAGVNRDNIEITLHDNALTISGERQNDLDDASFYVHERFYGAFRRSMMLPAGIDESGISACSDNGMLEITVRGGTVAEPRRIRIGDKPA